MGKITGFLEFTRELPAKRPVQERVKDYKEFVEAYPDEKLNQQSGRCMDCGVPFCHNGCPLGNVIPEFNDAVYRKSWKEAYTQAGELLTVAPASLKNLCISAHNVLLTGEL